MPSVDFKRPKQAYVIQLANNNMLAVGADEANDLVIMFGKYDDAAKTTFRVMEIKHYKKPVKFFSPTDKEAIEKPDLLVGFSSRSFVKRLMFTIAGVLNERSPKSFNPVP